MQHNAVLPNRKAFALCKCFDLDEVFRIRLDRLVERAKINPVLVRGVAIVTDFLFSVRKRAPNRIPVIPWMANENR